MQMPRPGVLSLVIVLLSLLMVTAGTSTPVTGVSAAPAQRGSAQTKATAAPTKPPLPTATPVPQVLIVTTTADVAPCPRGSGNPGFSLRCAMGLANSVGSGRTISFNIPPSDSGCHATGVGGTTVPVCMLALTRTLNLTASSTTIDGYTQPEASPNTRPLTEASDNAVLTIQLDGSSTFSGGLVLSNANGDRIRGLSITNFHNGPAILTSMTNDTTIDGDFIGIAPDGAVQGNAEGIRLTQVHNTVVGGTTPEARNRVSGSVGFGIAASQYGLNVTVQGNLITNNGSSGIGIGTDAQGVVIPVAIRQNLITNNGGFGIDDAPGGVTNCSVFVHYTSRFTPCPVIRTATARTASGTA